MRLVRHAVAGGLKRGQEHGEERTAEPVRIGSRAGYRIDGSGPCFSQCVAFRATADRSRAWSQEVFSSKVTANKRT